MATCGWLWFHLAACHVVLDKPVARLVIDMCSGGRRFATIAYSSGTFEASGTMVGANDFSRVLL
jgi:hypothetical protein